MAVGEEAGEEAVEQVALSHDYFAGFLAEPGNPAAGFSDLFIDDFEIEHDGKERRKREKVKMKRLLFVRNQ